MKQCPVCRTTYTDESLRYCLADGATLRSEPEEPTVFPGKASPIRPDIPERNAAKDISSRNSGAGRGWLSAALAFGIIGLVFVAAVVIAVVILYMNTGGRETSTKAATPAPTATTDAEKQRLQDELANLQKKLEEQKNSNLRIANAGPSPTISQPGTVTARVNSPNDGFLALRNIPDADRGERLAKIPHGSIVTLNNCEKNKVTTGGRSGRWCQVEYSGQTGWVFDAWLIY